MVRDRSTKRFLTHEDIVRESHQSQKRSKVNHVAVGRARDRVIS